MTVYILSLYIISCNEEQENNYIQDILSKSSYVNIYSGNDSLVLISHRMVLYINGFKENDFKIYSPFPNNKQINMYTEVLGRNVQNFKIIPLDTINNLISINIGRDGLFSLFNKSDSIVIQSILLKPKDSFFLNTNPSEWLVTTDCAQLHDKRVTDYTNSLNIDTSKEEFVRDIMDSISNINMTYRNYESIKLDAISTIKKNGSCLGKSNLLNAVLRSMNIPSRTKCISLSRLDSKLDYHTINEFYLNNKWTEVDPSFLKYDYNSIYDVELMLIFNNMEFPKLNSIAVYDYYYTDNTEFPDFPYWEGSLSSKALLVRNGYYTEIIENINLVRQLSISAYLLNNEESKNQLKKIISQLIDFKDSNNFELNINHNNELIIKSTSLFHMNRDIAKIEKNNWFFELVQNNYQLSTNVSDKYESNADQTCYIRELEIPSKGINVLYFEVLSDVEDSDYSSLIDKFWIDVLIGEELVPGITYLGGVNDDSDVNGLAGWSKFLIDLSDFNGKEISLRINFTSNESIEYSGIKLRNFEVINYDN